MTLSDAYYALARNFLCLKSLPTLSNSSKVTNLPQKPSHIFVASSSEILINCMSSFIVSSLVSAGIPFFLGVLRWKNATKNITKDIGQKLRGAYLESVFCRYLRGEVPHARGEASIFVDFGEGYFRVPQVLWFLSYPYIL